MKVYMVFPSIDEVTDFNWLLLRIQESIIRFLPVPEDIPWKLAITFSNLDRQGQGTLKISVTEGSKLKAKTMNDVPFSIIGGCSMHQFSALLSSELAKFVFSLAQGKVKWHPNSPFPDITFWNACAIEESYRISLAGFRESVGDHSTTGPERKEECPDCGHPLEQVGSTFACPQCTTQWFQG